MTKKKPEPSQATVYPILHEEGREDPVLLSDDRDRSLSVQRRVHEKIDDYERYNFSTQEKRALNIFFDLAQEFEDVEDLYTITVLVPKILFLRECNLYLLSSGGRFQPVRCSGRPSDVIQEIFSGGEKILYSPTIHKDRYFIPIKGNHEILEQLPFKPEGEVIGSLEIYPADGFSDHEILFFEKYANRVGFQLHRKMISLKNQEHLDFINSLVQDIGHNVIVPNMYFKLYFNRLKGKIQELLQLQEELGSHAEGPATPNAAYKQLQRKVSYIYDGLMSQFNEIFRHYEQTSLFLETLLRRSHFEQGHYVLDKRICDMRSMIIDPQLERYASRFEERDIEVDHAVSSAPDQEVLIQADVGLLSQVYANLFSNAIKYTRAAPGEDGRKYISYGWEYLRDYFGEGRAGVKLNVFSSGPPLAPEDGEPLYTSGFRASNVEGEYGTGHGLHFVRQVVELHGGVVGFEPTGQGNNFFFILPVREPDKS